MPGIGFSAARIQRVALLSLFLAVAALSLGYWVAPTAAQAAFSLVGRLHLISKSAGGSIGNDQSYQPDVNGDGRYVAFASDADNLVSDDNGSTDIFVYDRQTNSFEIVSLQSDGDQSNGNSYEPEISGDGRWVVFCSYASNLVSGDDNGRPDMFLYDRDDDDIRRLSDAPNGDDGNGDSCGHSAVSEGGQYVAFISDASNLVLSDTNNVRDVFLYERSTDSVRRLTGENGQQGNAASDWPSLSSDGRYIAFQSSATNLVTGDDNGRSDIFVYDRSDNDIERVSQRQDGADNNAASFQPSISGDARFVVFQADDGNLVDGDNNARSDIFLHVRDGNAVERISLDNDGGQPNDHSTQAAISDDGRYVTFTSRATDLIDTRSVETTNVFVRDRTAGATLPVSYADDDTPGNRSSDTPRISGNGRYVVFASSATNLLPEDPNERADVYLWDREGAPSADAMFTVTPNAGRAGSIFIGQITGFVPGSFISITINGQNAATLTADASGNARFGMNSSTADDGRYYVRVFDGTNERIAVFVVAANAPLVGGTAPFIFPIPAGIGYKAIYLPNVVHTH